MSSSARNSYGDSCDCGDDDDDNHSADDYDADDDRPRLSRTDTSSLWTYGMCGKIVND